MYEFSVCFGLLKNKIPDLPAVYIPQVCRQVPNSKYVNHTSYPTFYFIHFRFVKGDGLLLINDAILHHKRHIFQGLDICIWVFIQGDDIGQKTFLQLPQF